MALSASLIRPGADDIGTLAVVVKNGETIYQGSFVCIGGPSHASAGYALKYVPDTANLLPLGFAERYTVGDGTVTVPVRTKAGIFTGQAVTGLAGDITDVGKPVYLTDDGTFSISAQTGTNRRIQVGFIIRFRTSSVADVWHFSASDFWSQFANDNGQIPQVGRVRSKWLKVAVAGSASTSGGGLAAIANPEGVAIVVTRVVLQRTTKSTGAAASDIGIAANATTSSDNLIDGVALGATEAAEDNITDGGTNGKARQAWGASQYLTMTGAADSSGLVANLYVEYVAPN